MTHLEEICPETMREQRGVDAELKQHPDVEITREEIKSLERIQVSVLKQGEAHGGPAICLPRRQKFFTINQGTGQFRGDECNCSLEDLIYTISLLDHMWSLYITEHKHH